MKIFPALLLFNFANTFDAISTYAHYITFPRIFQEANPVYNLFGEIHIFLIFKMIIVTLIVIVIFYLAKKYVKFFSDKIVINGFYARGLIFLFAGLNNSAGYIYLSYIQITTGSIFT